MNNIIEIATSEQTLIMAVAGWSLLLLGWVAWEIWNEAFK